MTDSLYQTSDAFLASFVLSQGAELQGCKRASPRRVVYSFTSDERLHSLIRVYWASAPVTLVPSLLFTSYRRLKRLARSRRFETILPSEPAR